MKFIILILAFLYLSCQYQSEKNVFSIMQKGDSIMVNNISHEEWSNSVIDVIEKNNNLKEYEKSNLLLSVKNIKQADFNSVKNQSKLSFDKSKNLQQVYIFYYSQGEILIYGLCCLSADNNTNTNGARLKIESSKMKIEKLENLSNINIDNLKTDIISVQNTYQDFVIITKRKNNIVLSELGNMNKSLADVILK